MGSLVHFAVLLVLPGALIAQTASTPVQPGSVAGRIANAQTGEPVPGVRLQLTPAGGVGSQMPQRLSMTSQPDGTFVFDTVAPGIYFLVPQKAGFVFANQGVALKPFTVGPNQQVSDVNIQLTPEGSISGKVTDEEGTPLPGMRIEAMSVYVLRGQPQLRRSSTIVTDAQGNFKTRNLSPGKYYLAAEPSRSTTRGGEPQPAPPEAAAATQTGTAAASGSDDQTNYDFIRTFYPRVPDFESATPLDVGAGQDVADINIRMRRGATYSIRGRVDGLAANAQAPNLTLSERDGGSASAISVKVLADRSFEISKVQPGRYTLRMLGRDDQISAYPAPARARLLARQDVDVSSADIEGMVLAIQPAISLAGRVTVSGTDANVNVAQIKINVVSAENVSYNAFSSAASKPDGTFAIQGLDPGKYFVRAYGAPSGTYIKSITFNQQDITNTEMDLSAGSSGDLEVMVRGGTGEVDGSLQSGSAPAAMVILIPQSIPPDSSGLLVGRPSNGTFVIPNVPPGHYYAFAVQKLDQSFWQSSDFVHALLNNGATVDLDENGRTQVQLTTIPLDQIQDTASRFGLIAR